MMSKISAYLFLLTSLAACTAPIDIHTRDSEPVIVIYGCLNSRHQHQSVRITRSSPYFDDEANRPVTDAQVRIADSGGHDYVLLHGGEGYYFSETRFHVSAGVTYRLLVEVDFDEDGTNETYEAETTVRPPLTIDSITVRPLTIMGFRRYSLNVYAQDPPEAGNCYLFRFFINDSISNNRISNYVVTDDEFFNGSYLENTIYYFEDGADGHVGWRNGDDDPDRVYMVSRGDRVRLQSINIEAGYYQFINECKSEMRGENPMFGGPPSNITTNISNGAVGFFTGYCIRENKTIVP
jgi:hypothetical protein